MSERVSNEKLQELLAFYRAPFTATYPTALGLEVALDLLDARKERDEYQERFLANASRADHLEQRIVELKRERDEARKALLDAFDHYEDRAWAAKTLAVLSIARVAGGGEDE